MFLLPPIPNLKNSQLQLRGGTLDAVLRCFAKPTRSVNETIFYSTLHHRVPMTDEFAAINAAAAISSSKNNAEASATGDGAEEVDNKTSRDYRYDDIERWEKDYESWSKYMFVLRDLDFEFFSSFVCV